MWNLPRPAAIEPVSPALASRFLSTAPPGKSPTLVNFDRPINYVSLEFFKFRLGITSFEKLFVVIPNFEFFFSWFSSVQLLSRVLTLVTPGLQHARLLCPSPTPGACSYSCPSSWWRHPTVSSSVIPFSSWVFLSLFLCISLHSNICTFSHTLLFSSVWISSQLSF